MEALRKDFRALFLAGGGMKTSAYLGALDLLGVEQFSSISGVSAGALLALLLSVGYRPRCICRLFQEEDWSALFSESFSFERLARGRAPVARERLDRTLSGWLQRKGVPRGATFAWLRERGGGARFSCFALDLEAVRLMRFDSETSPGVRLLDATLASMAVPLFFSPVRLRGRKYVDAAVLNNAPLSLCPERPLLALVPFQAPPPCLRNSLGQHLSPAWIRSSLLTTAELTSFQGGRVVHMPRAPSDVHVFRLESEALARMLSSGRLAITVSVLKAEVLLLLTLAVLRLLTIAARSC